MPNFPGSFDTFRHIENLPNKVYDPTAARTLYVEDFRQLQEILLALEDVLGLSAAGAFASVAARIASLEARVAQLESETPADPRGPIKTEWGAFLVDENGRHIVTLSADTGSGDDGVANLKTETGAVLKTETGARIAII